VAAWSAGGSLRCSTSACGSGRTSGRRCKPEGAAYEGHDLSAVALRPAEKFLRLGCPLHFGEATCVRRCEGDGNSNLIFSGFTLHHFTAAERTEILRDIRRRLAPGGLVLLIDSVRDEVAAASSGSSHYAPGIEREWRAIPADGLKAIVEHIRGHDQPGTWSEHAAGGARRRVQSLPRETPPLPLARASGRASDYFGSPSSGRMIRTRTRYRRDSGECDLPPKVVAGLAVGGEHGVPEVDESGGRVASRCSP